MHMILEFLSEFDAMRMLTGFVAMWLLAFAFVIVRVAAMHKTQRRLEDKLDAALLLQGMEETLDVIDAKYGRNTSRADTRQMPLRRDVSEDDTTTWDNDLRKFFGEDTVIDDRRKDKQP